MSVAIVKFVVDTVKVIDMTGWLLTVEIDILVGFVMVCLVTNSE